MERRARLLLKRLIALEDGDGLRQTASLGRILFFVGLVLSILAGLAIAFGLHSGIVGLLGLAVGFIIAERNALRSRILQWPTFRAYIDWQRVRTDVKPDA